MLDWFTTIPGILIICGVILLVIAIILFIVGAKKSKKGTNNVTQTADNNMSPVMNQDNSVNTLNTTPVVEDVIQPSVDTVVNTEISNADVIKIEEPVVNMVSETEVPVVNNIIEDVPPVINIPDMNTQEEVNPIKIEEPTVIYGGEVPTVDFSTSEEKTVTIYGGNDPLDATQTLPKMEENHTPYGGVYPEVRIVEPTVSESVPTPVEETVTTMQTIEPEVINIPVVEPIVIPEPTVVADEINSQESTPIVEEL